MQPLIKILPQFVANRIAAGEVVGRPESVVKELIENSLDAGSQKIQLRIKDSGKNLIQVFDDGSGMGEEDAVMCFQRHSTSKISSAEDLENINTLGFRGEALASISAVAQVELVTRTEGSELETVVKNYGGEIVDKTFSTGSLGRKGSSVSVKNLFYNTPARRNFLKSNQTEFRHIYDTFVRLAIAHPAVAFIFINEDEEIFDLHSANLRKRIEQIYGNDFAETLIPIEQESGLISLNGYISRPSFTKKTKQDQFLFLNDRYIVNKSISYAVHLAYGDLIEKGDYPNFFLFIHLDPNHFDVNVHPSKLEVKFDNEKAIFGFVRKSIISTLEQNNLIAKIEINSLERQTDEGQFKIYPSSNFTVSGSRKERIFEFKKPAVPDIHEILGGSGNRYSKLEEEGESREGKSTTREVPDRSLTHEELENIKGKSSIWQFQKKYIMYQLENTLMIIDQHAAHERILYEQALERLNSNANLSQQLLIPLNVDLNIVDYEVARSIEKELGSLGFDIDLLSRGKVRINGIPSDVRLGDETKILQEIIDEFKENDVKLNLEKRDNLAKSFACKHAIRTGDKLNEDEMLNLIDKLFAVKMPYVCPHGRPTIVKISMDELDKKFARTGF
ncbi:MAG: DNA mismatch repair endonuclease MutL [Ignavibacteria bacterium]